MANAFSVGFRLNLRLPRARTLVFVDQAATTWKSKRSDCDHGLGNLDRCTSTVFCVCRSPVVPSVGR
jgi:hypothetical protein